MTLTPQQQADVNAKNAETAKAHADAEKTRAEAEKSRADAEQVRASTDAERHLAQNKLDVAAADLDAKRIASTRPVAPGPIDDDLPDHDVATMKRLFSRPRPDWTDRAAVAAFVGDAAEPLGNDRLQAHATAARIWDRTTSSDPSVHQANQLGTVFARLDCAPRWRERLSELTLPTLVVHGAADSFFPVGNGEALAAEIPDARLLVLDDLGSALQDAAADKVANAMLAL